MERRRVEAMQRRKKRGARNSLPCALSCLKSNIHAEGGGGGREGRNDAGFSLAHYSGHRLGSLSEDAVFAVKKSREVGPAE